LAARKANEGSKQDKKWGQAKALQRDEEEDNYMAPQSGKTARQRERKERQVVEIDHRFVEQPRERGGYRGARGGRGSGEARGDGGRGGGRGRGDFRGGRGGGEGRGGESRGGEARGRGRGGTNVNVSDTRAFPSLGS
jgi:plasminogen activator inhibitor 1 RNA-binding protein